MTEAPVANALRGADHPAYRVDWSLVSAQDLVEDMRALAQLTSIETAGRLMEAFESEKQRRYYVPSWGREPALFEQLVRCTDGPGEIGRRGLAMNAFTERVLAECGFVALVRIVGYWGGGRIYVQDVRPIREAQFMRRVRQRIEMCKVEVCRELGITRRHLEQILEA